MRILIRSAAAFLLILSVNCGLGDDGTEQADQVLGRITENWRWSHYWFGKTGMDDVYAAGKRITALVFWNKNESRPVRGLCSPELALCVAYSGIYLDPAERRMSVSSGVSMQQAFASFITSGLRDSSHIAIVDGLSPADFQTEQTSITLPPLGPPSSITKGLIPEGAARDAEKVKRVFGCWGVEAETRPRGCAGTLVLAFYGENDPYWFVLRSCSTACEFKGEAVEMLRRGDRGWEVTSAGLVNRTEEIQRLKHLIEKAEMFRLPL